ncbi:MAG: hypothetical protein AAGB19_17515 [Cyanobacteria bacterium P01_F01_bin.3]
MKYDPPHTVDISAEPLRPFQPPVVQSLTTRMVVAQSLGLDVFFIVLSLLVGVLFSGAVSAIDTTGIENVGLLKPPTWLIFAACALPPALWLFVDGLSAMSNPAVLPFARSRTAMKAVYAKRIHLLLLAFYFTAILVALCWSAFAMLLVSKLFVSAIFAVALYALGQSIPSRRLSFVLSGFLFLVVLITTQSFIVLKMEADSQRANQEALGDFDAPPEPVIDESIFEERGE